MNRKKGDTKMFFVKLMLFNVMFDYNVDCPHCYKMLSDSFYSMFIPVLISIKNERLIVRWCCVYSLETVMRSDMKQT